MSPVPRRDREPFGPTSMTSQSPAAVAARRASRVRRSVTEVGPLDHVALQASGLHQGATVHDRVREWQEHGAASAPAPDAVSVFSMPRSQAFTEEDYSPHRGAHDDAPNRQRKVDRRQSRSYQKDEQITKKSHRIRSASTPRKRVVSDEHWRLNRDLNSHMHAVSTEWEHINSEALDMLQTLSPKPVELAKAERDERRRRQAEAKTRKTREPIRASRDHGERRSSPEPDPNLIPIESTSILEAASNPGSVIDTGIDFMKCDTSVLKFDDNAGVDDHLRTPPEKSKYVETLKQPLSAHQDPQIKSKKGSLLNKTKEVLGIATPPQPESNRLPSITAWLDDQPDPFTEELPSQARLPENPLKPPKQRSVKRSAPRPDVVALDPNRIWDSINSPVQNKEIDSSVPIVNDAELTSPVSLKRRGAKASRQKRHTLADIPVEAEPQPPECFSEISKDLPKDQKDVEQQRRSRICPQTGPTKLSTIASVETFHPPPQDLEQTEAVEKDQNEPNDGPGLSRRALRKSTRRKRSIKTTDHRQNTDPVKQILETLAEEQDKYGRELRTLVDGVIPVLLQCVLSKSDAVAAAGLFTNRTDLHHDLSFNRPIVDMGISLERIKTLHNRIPFHNVDSLFSWCQSAQKAYAEYIKAWRLGFQDVVINLAPLDNSDGEGSEAMARDARGDVVNSEGETVDIAYLMKRPLVNVRKIGRVLSCLHEELPDHPVAEKIAHDYHELTAAAKIKHQQEKGRLEDEAAALIDATKCRDIRNLGPLLGVAIDKNKRVRARDCFDMTLFHSTGQRMDCKIEMILRDNHQDSPDGGDVLVCQIDDTGKWLLFAPVDLSHVSARKGESGCDLVIMLRGRAGINEEWRELLALKADEPEAISEWMMMLGSNPLPPKLSRVPSFVNVQSDEPVQPLMEAPPLTRSLLRRVASTETIDIPIGEPSILGVTSSKIEKPEPVRKQPLVEKPLPKLNMGGGLQRKDIPEHWQTQYSTAMQKPFPESVVSSARSTSTGYSAGSASTYAPSSLAPMAPVSPPKQQQKQQKQKQKEKQQSVEAQNVKATPVVSPSQRALPPTPISNRDQQPLQKIEIKDSDSKPCEKSHSAIEKSAALPKQQTAHRALPPPPPEQLSHVSKVRGTSPSNIPLTDTIRETWSNISGYGRKVVSQPSTPTTKNAAAAPVLAPETRSEKHLPETNFATPQEVPRRNTAAAETEPKTADDMPPPPPPQHKVPVLTPRSRNIPSLGPSEAQKRMDREKGRLSSSPLRKEYTPSSASTSENSSSGSSSDSEYDSQTSDEHDAGSGSPVDPKNGLAIARSYNVPSAYARTAPTTGTRTLAPSDSASQGPYRRVPGSAERPDAVQKKTMAMICSWDDKGMWQPLVDEACLIVVSPGLMEAFAMDKAHSSMPMSGQRPLAAFELTPIVPLRRPTGLDINIRSPPRPESQIVTSNNIMFRSQSAHDCEKLYQMINWARCNNPTYLELERSRPRIQPPVTFSDQQAPRPRSWWSFGSGIKRRNSYRVSSVPPSSMGESQMTTNTVSSRLSAIRRLTKSSAFNVNRSSVTRRPGVGTSDSYSSSNGTGIGSGSSTPPLSQLGHIPGKEGPNAPATSAEALNGGGMVHNKTIRLQIRRPNGTWEMIGPSKLTILPAVKRSDGSPEVSRPGSSGSNGGGESTTTGSAEPAERSYRLSSAYHTPHRLHGGGREKRIVITWTKDSSRVLLDATLGESCFEMLSPYSIAVQVWRAEDEVRSRGGVNLGQNTMYKLIFKKATDCSWVFGLVGKYRYGNAMTS